MHQVRNNNKKRGKFGFIIDFLFSTDGSTSLHRAAYKGNDQMLRILLEYGAYVNAQDSYNRSAMHWSTRNKNTNCLKVKESKFKH